eukprot:7043701-Pyramimonas_sp.AAC.1
MGNTMSGGHEGEPEGEHDEWATRRVRAVGADCVRAVCGGASHPPTLQTRRAQHRRVWAPDGGQLQPLWRAGEETRAARADLIHRPRH